MASLYKHKIHGFQVRFRVFLPGGDKTRYRYARSRDEAHELLRVAEMVERGSRRGDLSDREVLVAKNLGVLTDADAVALSGGRSLQRYDLSVLQDRWVRSSKEKNTPYGHLVNVRRARYLLEWLRLHPLPTLTESDVRQYLHDRREGLLVFKNRVTGFKKVGVSSKTLKNDLQVLRSLIDVAVDLGMVDKNVARDVDVKVKKQRIRRAMSAEEVKRLLVVAQEAQHLCHGYAYWVILLALYSGLRRNEIRTLRWSDIDLNESTITVQAKTIPGEDPFVPKGGKARVVTVPERLSLVLSEMPRSGEWVFGGDAPIVSNRFYKTFKEIAALAGLDPSLSLHHARHTYGSWLLRQSGDLMLVQAELGHSDPMTTIKYLHVVSDRSASKKLDYGDE